MILLINGSPKLEGSNSNYFLNKIRNNEKIKYIYRDNFKNILNDIKKVNTLIFAFPLYVDSPPCKVIEFMEYIKNNNIDLENKNIYTIINCGFLEACQNNTASLIFKNFALNNKACYKGTFNIGAGEIIGKRQKKKLYKLVSIPFNYKIKKFKISIYDSKEITLNTTIHPMTKKTYIYLANINWKKQMIKNNCFKREN